MTVVLNRLPDTISGVAITRAPQDLYHISDRSCGGIIWHRQPLAGFQSWIDGVAPDHLPSARLLLRPQAVRVAMTTLCNAAQTPEDPHRTRLIDDIAALAAGTMSPADFLVPSTIVIDSVTVVGPDVLVEFTGAPNSDYKMTESVDLISEFTDTSPLAETTTDGSGKGTIMWPLAGDGKFGRVEKK